jgi:hypothetical protein
MRRLRVRGQCEDTSCSVPDVLRTSGLEPPALATLSPIKFALKIVDYAEIKPEPLQGRLGQGHPDMTFALSQQRETKTLCSEASVANPS